MTFSRILRCSVLLTAGAVMTFAQSAAKPPADILPDSHARLPYLQRKNISEADLKTFNALPAIAADGSLGGPLAFAAYNMAGAKALSDLHGAAVGGSLTPHVRELAILVACRETNYNLEWNGHQSSAKTAGIDAKVVDVIRTGGALTGLDEKDAVVIRYGRQILTEKKVDSATFAKVVEFFGQKGSMDIVTVMTTYAASGFYALAVDEQAPAGKTPLEPIKK